jgi:Tol biopolymer transport system component
MLTRLILAAICCGTALPAFAARIIYLAEQDAAYLPELFLVDLEQPGVSLKLNKPLSLYAHGVIDFAVSPDGAHVAYSADQDMPGDADLYLADITAPGTWTRVGDLPPGSSETFVKWSPDGEMLAFTASDEFYGDTQLYLVERSNPGSATRMNGELAVDGVVSLTGFEFTPDGSHLVYVAGERERKFELYAVALDRPGQSVRLNAPGGGSLGDSYEGRFHILPDSRRVVYSAVQAHAGQREVHIVSIDAPESPTTLNAPFNAGGYVHEFVVSPDGRYVAYLADAEIDGVNQTWLVATDLPETATRVNGTAQNSALLQFTDDGQYLLFTADRSTGTGERDLFMVPVEGAADPVRLSASLQAGFGVSRYSLSADSMQVAYPVTAPGGFAEDLHVARIDSPGSAAGGNGEFAGGSIEVFPSAQFSPDGSQVAFIAVQSVDTLIQELFVATVSAPGTSFHANAALAPGAIVPPIPGAFEFLPAAAPPTGMPSTGAPPAAGKTSGGGSVGALMLLWLGLWSLRRVRRV